MQVSDITRFLENAYDILNQEYFGGSLSPVIITVQSSPKAYGHYTTWDAWAEEQQGYREINIGAETLDREVSEVLATLLHEMSHHYCAMSGIKDTSRGGTYHNKKFKEVAEGTGALVIGYDSRIGHSPTTPSDALIAFIQTQGWQDVNLSRKSITSGRSGGKQRVRKYQCPECGCSVRATKEVHIGCLDCECEMELQEN